jgi:RecJ-like exonuclease
MKTCPDCNGDGVIDKGTDDEKQCPTCGGSGFVPDDNDDKNNEEIIRTSWERATGPGPEPQPVAASVDPRRDGAKPVTGRRSRKLVGGSSQVCVQPGRTSTSRLPQREHTTRVRNACTNTSPG